MDRILLNSSVWDFSFVSERDLYKWMNLLLKNLIIFLSFKLSFPLRPGWSYLNLMYWSLD